jgi:hypothetical protein
MVWCPSPKETGCASISFVPRWQKASGLDRVVPRVERRTWPIVVSSVYVVIGLAFCFRWGPVVRHVPSLWIRPVDLGVADNAATSLAHGHFGAIYQSGAGFLAYPALLFVLAPLGAINFGGSFIQIAANHHLLTHPVTYIATSSSNLLIAGSPVFSGGDEYVLHPNAVVALVPTALVISCVALFACDALAERLQVSRTRRVALVVAEAVILWNVTVLWGHPEDAVAVAFAIYALIFGIDERFTGAGWLFGAALAFQPLVLVMFPLLLFLGGKDRALGLIVRGVVPALVVTVAPLLANFHDTVHVLVTQPTFPYNFENHQTPWTFLAPRQGGSGSGTAIGAGWMRIPALALAVGVGWWARRWRNRPEMIAWAVALTLALRLCFEVTMTDYYAWPALAVALVVAARCSQLRFAAAITIAVVTTVVAQWNFGWLPWWSIQVAGVAGLLAIASRPDPLVPKSEEEPHRQRATVPVHGSPSSGSEPAMKDVAARTRAPAVAQVRTKSGSGGKQRPRPGKRRSGNR